MATEGKTGRRPLDPEARRTELRCWVRGDTASVLAAARWSSESLSDTLDRVCKIPEVRAAFQKDKERLDAES